MIKNEFIKFLAKNHIVQQGEFTLKNGKSSKVYYDFGRIGSGTELLDLGRYYATYIMSNLNHNPPDLLLGAAHKGIVIAIATSIVMEQFGLPIPYAFDRPDTKHYGDGRLFIGKSPAECNRILILDDVFTSGLAKTLLISKIPGYAQRVMGILVGVDRMELDQVYNKPNSELFTSRIGLPVYSLVTGLDMENAQ